MGTSSTAASPRPNGVPSSPDWADDFRALPGGCTLGSLALATSPFARDTQEPLVNYATRRLRGKHGLNVKLRFTLWVLAHYGSAAARDTVALALPKLLAVQRDDGLWEFEPYSGGGAGLVMMDAAFADPVCATYRMLEALHLVGLLDGLAAAGEFKGCPFEPFGCRGTPGGIVARRDFERRPRPRDAELTRHWIDTILADESADGSWQGSVMLTSHALHLFADLHADRRVGIERGLSWLRRMFRRDAAMPVYDHTSRRANPKLCTFGAVTDPLVELEACKRITDTTFDACCRRVGGTQSAYCVWALNRWGEGACTEAREWVEQTKLLGGACGNFASRAFLRLRHDAGEIDLTPRELRACSHADVVAAAERLSAVKCQFAGTRDQHGDGSGTP